MHKLRVAHTTYRMMCLNRRLSISSSSSPVIGVLCCFSESKDQVLTHNERHAVANKYLNPLYAFDTIPVLIPASSLFDIDTLLERLDGVVLPGSPSNIHPSEYNREETSRHPPFDVKRDEIALRLIRRTIEIGVPLLAICRGFQELNVAFGGTLHPYIDDLDGRLEHTIGDFSTDPAIRFAPAHEIVLDPSSQVLSNLFNNNKKEKLFTNTCHFQCIDDVAPNLRVEARALDGTIEALSVNDSKNFALGVQWHPEFNHDQDSISREIFSAFCEATRKKK